MFKKFINWLLGKKEQSKIYGKVIDYGFNELGQAIVTLHVENGNLYDLAAHRFKNKNHIGFTISVEKQPESPDAN